MSGFPSGKAAMPASWPLRALTSESKLDSASAGAMRASVGGVEAESALLMTVTVKLPAWRSEERSWVPNVPLAPTMATVLMIMMRGCGVILRNTSRRVKAEKMSCGKYHQLGPPRLKISTLSGAARTCNCGPECS